MSPDGQAQTSGMSALPPKADIAESDWHVRFVPQATSCIAINRFNGRRLLKAASSKP
jgi:hypothetical protein